MISRRDILIEALDKCILEMYRCAQPSVNASSMNELVQLLNDSKDDPAFMRHYLSKENFESILEVYKTAYNIQDEFRESIKMLKESLEQHEGGELYGAEISQDTAKGFAAAMGEWLKFFRKDHYLTSFEMELYLGCTPTSNKDDVIKYWKSKGVDLVIKDFDYFGQDDEDEE